MIKKFFHSRKHISWALLDQSLVSGVNFLTGILLARFLGIKDFGIFSLAWMMALFINNQQVSMIISPMMSIGPKQAINEAPAYFGAVIVQQVVFSGISVVLTLIGAKLAAIFYPHWQLQCLTLPLSAAIFFFLSQDFLRRYFFTLGKAEFAFLNDLVSYGGQLIILWLLTRIATLDIASALWIIAATSAAAVFVGMFTLGPIKIDTAKFGPVAIRHWNSSSWIAVSSLIQWLGSQGAIVITGAMLGATSLGGIRAVVNLVAPVNVIMQGLRNTMPVAASKALYNQGHEGLIKYLIRQTIFIVSIILVISLFAATFSNPLMSFVYGSKYSAFDYLVKWQSVYVVIGAFVLPLMIYFGAIEKTKNLMFCTLVATILSLLFLQVFIKSLQEQAVYVALITNQLVTLVLLAHAMRGKMIKEEERISG